MIKFIIDMMGGDLGPLPLAKAIDTFLVEHEDVEVYAVGKEEEIKNNVKNSRCHILDARDVIAMDENPMAAIKSKESSMIKAFALYKELSADAIISTGGTGAYLTAATLLLGRLPGIMRPALVAPFPTKIKGKKVVILDVGASNKNTSDELVQFAKMGLLYSKYVFSVETPSVYMLSNGTEDHKGSPTSQEAVVKLRELDFPGFKGNIEAREALHGYADVVVTDGFTGNIFLKSTEGSFKLVSALLKEGFKKNICTMTGYLLSRSVTKNISDTFDYKSTGGAMLLGVKGNVIKAHGNSDEKGMAGALKVAYSLALNDIAHKIEMEINK
ncbi:MAG: phosphate acyltransferase PlsX [Bacilli bacterium]